MNNKPVFLTVVNFLGRILNFSLYLVIANKFGASQRTDWFFFVYSIIYFFVGIFFYASESALVPSWHRLVPDDHPRVFGKAFFFSFFATLMIALIVCFSGFILAPGLHISVPIGMGSALLILLMLSIQPALAFLSSLFSSYYQYQQKYFLPTIHLSLRAIGVLAVLFLTDNSSICWLAAAYLAGESFRFFCLFRKICLHGVFSGALPRSKETHFWTIYRNVGWTTIALALTVINPVVDLAMGGKMGYGSVSLVEYAGRLRGLPVLALGGILIYLLGEWSYTHHQSGKRLVWPQVRGPFLLAVCLVSAIVILMVITLNTWMPLVFFSKQFNANVLFRLKSLMWWYLPGVPMLAGSMVLSRAMLVMQQARSMAVVALVAALLNIFFNGFFMKFLGLDGLALSTSIVDTVVCLTYWSMVKRMLSESLNEPNELKL